MHSKSSTQTPEVVPRGSLNIGVIGWGGRGGSVALSALRASGGVMRTTACVEPEDDKYQYGCNAFEMKPTRYKSVSEMLSGQRLDGVVIASPNQFHLEHLKQLESSGLPLLLEKPLDSTFEKICDVVRFASSYKAPILVGHCMRYAPILREAKNILKRGDIGKLCSVRFVQHCHYGNSGYHNWRRRADLSGTWFLEKATHDFDIMNWMVEDLPATIVAVTRLQAFGGNKPADLRCRACDEKASCPESVSNISFRNGNQIIEEQVNLDDLCVFSSEVTSPDNEVALIQFGGGVFGTYHQWFFSPRSYYHRIYEFQGTLGAMEVDLGAEHGGDILICPRFGTPSSQTNLHFDYLKRNHYNGDGPMGMHFMDVILGRAAPETSVEQAFQAELLGYSAILAAKENRCVDVQQTIPKGLLR
jgi:predicted dehydrogenase